MVSLYGTASLQQRHSVTTTQPLGPLFCHAASFETRAQLVALTSVLRVPVCLGRTHRSRHTATAMGNTSNMDREAQAEKSQASEGPRQLLGTTSKETGPFTKTFCAHCVSCLCSRHTVLTASFQGVQHTSAYVSMATQVFMAVQQLSSHGCSLRKPSNVAIKLYCC